MYAKKKVQAVWIDCYSISLSSQHRGDISCQNSISAISSVYCENSISSIASHALSSPLLMHPLSLSHSHNPTIPQSHNPSPLHSPRDSTAAHTYTYRYSSLSFTPASLCRHPISPYTVLLYPSAHHLHIPPIFLLFRGRDTPPSPILFLFLRRYPSTTHKTPTRRHPASPPPTSTGSSPVPSPSSLSLPTLPPNSPTPCSPTPSHPSHMLTLHPPPTLQEARQSICPPSRYPPPPPPIHRPITRPPLPSPSHFLTPRKATQFGGTRGDKGSGRLGVRVRDDAVSHRCAERGVPRACLRVRGGWRWGDGMEGKGLWDGRVGVGEGWERERSRSRSQSGRSGSTVKGYAITTL